MSPVEIDPATGAPIIPSSTPSPVTSETSNDTTKDFVTASESDENVQKDSEASEEASSEEIPEMVEQAPLTREEFLTAVSDVLRRYTSDSQSHAKALAEVTELVK